MGSSSVHSGCVAHPRALARGAPHQPPPPRASATVPPGSARHADCSVQVRMTVTQALAPGNTVFNGLSSGYELGSLLQQGSGPMSGTAAYSSLRKLRLLSIDSGLRTCICMCLAGVIAASRTSAPFRA